MIARYWLIRGVTSPAGVLGSVSAGGAEDETAAKTGAGPRRKAGKRGMDPGGLEPIREPRDGDEAIK
ncbi:hypothetical protein ROR02_09710 [Pararhodospirillum oryzae]|uniref:Uncharacterized protein n=1 Tax=Pararhodospirillum oryzae TaxID=478448 RepID=A0A512H630_9PROT|nr:hypothetical protein ROR02_09710 [Pararhodospirillum oryzae]